MGNFWMKVMLNEEDYQDALQMVLTLKHHLQEAVLKAGGTQILKVEVVLAVA